jgi:hypothetical protein
VNTGWRTFWPWYLTGSASQSIPPVVPSFLPTDISSLELWLDADDPATITLDVSDNVQQWDDKSGNGYDAIQSTATKRPGYVTAFQNGKNALLLDDIDDELPFNAVSANPTTWFMVHKWSGSNVECRAISNRAVNGIGVGTSSASSYRLSFVREGIAWVTSSYSQPTTSLIWRFEFAGGTSSMWTYSSGSETAQQTISSTGSADAPAAFSYSGHLFEIIRYGKALTAEEVASVNAYLAAKWGIS